MIDIHPIEPYGYEQAGKSLYANPSPLEALKSRRTQLQSSIQTVEAAITALESCPEVNNVLELLSKARHL